MSARARWRARRWQDVSPAGWAASSAPTACSPTPFPPAPTPAVATANRPRFTASSDPAGIDHDWRLHAMTTTEPAPAALTVDFDVYDPSLAEPADVMQARVAELAAKGPVVYSTAHGGHWVVTRYKEIHEVLTDTETFSSYPNNLVTPADFGKFIPLELDPPEHTAYRHALLPLFSPQRMKQLSEDIRGVVNDLIDQFASKGEVEFVSAFARELPAKVFLALMDWPIDDAPMFIEATDAVLFGKPGGTKEESDQAMMMAAMTIAGYFNNVIAERRGKDGEDATSKLINTEVELPDGKRLLADE